MLFFSNAAEPSKGCRGATGDIEKMNSCSCRRTDSKFPAAELEYLGRTVGSNASIYEQYKSRNSFSE